MNGQPENQTAIADAPDISSPTSTMNIRATKRKLDDAFQVLDDAVGSTDTLPRSSPPKKTHSIRSLYSTLAKYGVRSKESWDRVPNTSERSSQTFSKNTPHLTAILTRAATRTRKALPSKFSAPSPVPALPPTAEYRPSSIPAFLSRLSTFKLATYANKPPAIDAVAASKCGWINDGKDRLVCGLCTSSWVVAGREGMNRDAANALIEKQRVSLVDMHKNGCPWKTRQCDPTIYRIPLQSPSVMVRDLKSNAIALESSLRNVEVRHPLAANQLNSLRATISSFTLPLPAEPRDSGRDDGDVFISGSTDTPERLDTAILTALFGWVLVPPEPRRVPLSRANSLVPSSPSTPSPSRSISLTHPRPPTSPGMAPSPLFTFQMPLKTKHDPTLLQCPLCQRRVGLWAFTSSPSGNGTTGERPQTPVLLPDGASPRDTAPASPPHRQSLPKRQFDLLKEHRSYCPYVVRSTIVPSLPSPSSNNPVYGHTRSNSTLSQLNAQTGNGTVEGWRAVLTVLLRYGKGQRQRMGLDYLGAESLDTQESEGDGVPMEVDGVKAMVTGVKSRGGKDLLRYVKGLLS